MGHFNYQKGRGKWENWLISEKVFDVRYLAKCESIFCQGNGYLGVRNALEEAYVSETRGMFVSGTFNKCHEDEVSELPNLPDVTNLSIRINDRPFSLTEGRIISYERTLNLRNGEVNREVEWESPLGERLRFSFARTVSMTDRHGLAERVVITPLTGEVKLGIVSGIDGRVTNSGAQHMEEGERRLYESTFLEYLCRTTESRIPVAIHAAHRFFLNGQPLQPGILPVIERRQIKLSTEVRVPAGASLVMEKLASVHTGRDPEYENLENSREAVREKGKTHIRQLFARGYREIQEESAVCWEKLWQEQDVVLKTKTAFDQLALRFALYHLNIMVNREDNRVGIGAKALSGEGYKGHSFWDTEIFLFPYYLCAQPGIARRLLEYRYLGLEGARRKAAEYGYRGAMYPWEAAWIEDGEVTPLYGPADVVTGEPLKYWTGLIEQHISADIAFAVWQYREATGDEVFMQQYGYEMIFDTARFWLSRLEWQEEKGRYEIHDVIGPDEYKEHVDNDVYTNYLAAYNLSLASRLYEALTVSREAEEKAVEKRLEAKLQLKEMQAEIQRKLPLLYLPEPEPEQGIIPQSDGYFDLEYLDITRFKESSEVLTIYKELSQEQINHFQISKQGDLVVLFFLLEDLFDEETKRKNYQYYEERTLHDSSLSKSTHSIVASDLGLKKEAYTFYQGSCQVDLGDEMKSSDAGIHAAAMGGIWQAAVQGFGGVRITNGKLRIMPRLPEECEELSFPLYYRKAIFRVRITREEVLLTNTGEAEEVELCGEVVRIEKGVYAKKL